MFYPLNYGEAADAWRLDDQGQRAGHYSSKLTALTANK